MKDLKEYIPPMLNTGEKETEIAPLTALEIEKAKNIPYVLNIINCDSIFDIFTELKSEELFMKYYNKEEIESILRYFSLVYNHQSPFYSSIKNEADRRKKSALLLGWVLAPKSKHFTLYNKLNDLTSVSNKKYQKLLLAYYKLYGNPMTLTDLWKIAMSNIVMRNVGAILIKRPTAENKDEYLSAKENINLLKAYNSLLEDTSSSLRNIDEDSKDLFGIIEKDDEDLLLEEFTHEDFMMEKYALKNQ